MSRLPALKFTPYFGRKKEILMKKTILSVAKFSVFALVMGALAYSSTALAKKPGGGGGGGGGTQCPDVWDPVICSDGQVYSNYCYASVAGATGCVPYGDNSSARKSSCPRDIGCPDIYDPVTCSDGVTYPNACYAYRACATGCSGGGGGGGT